MLFYGTPLPPPYPRNLLLAWGVSLLSRGVFFLETRLGLCFVVPSSRVKGVGGLMPTRRYQLSMLLVWHDADERYRKILPLRDRALH